MKLSLLVLVSLAFVRRSSAMADDSGDMCPIREGNGYACCGVQNTVYDTDTSYCCGGSVSDEPCFEVVAPSYDPEGVIMCGGGLRPGDSCCEGNDGTAEAYFESTQYCCEGFVIVGDSCQSAEDPGTEEETGSSRDTVVCDGVLQDGDMCCGSEAYFESTHQCCEGIRSEFVAESCSSDEVPVMEQELVFCDGKLQVGDSCCNNAIAYYAETDKCCEDGSVVTSATKCAVPEYNSESIDAELILCNDVTGEGNACCGSVAYDSEADGKVCCETTASGFTLYDGNSCCAISSKYGSLGYDSSEEVCCDSSVQAGDACCGSDGYFTEDSICCSGALGDGDECCETESFDSSTQSCCEGAVTDGTSCLTTTTPGTKYFFFENADSGTGNLRRRV